MCFNLFIKYRADKHVDETDYSDIANNPAHQGLLVWNRVVAMRVLVIGQENLLISNFIFLPFLVILHDRSLEMLHDLYEATFKWIFDTVEDVHMDSIVFIDRDIMLA